MRTRARWKPALVALSLGGAGAGQVLAQCDWTGAGADKKWTTVANWTNCNGGYPDVADNDADLLVPASGHTTCEYDWFNYVSLDLVTITGSSPTFFTLHVLDTDFMPNMLDINDYSKFDVDKLLRIRASDPATTLSGTIEMDLVDVPAASPRNTEGYDAYLYNAYVDGDNTQVTLTTATGADLRFDDLSIDAHHSIYGGNHRRLRINGGTTVVNDTLTIRAEPETTKTAYKAKLHFVGSTFTAKYLRMHAGQTSDRQIELDIDDNVTITDRTNLEDWDTIGTGGGKIVADVAVGKVMKFGELIIQGPCEITVGGTVPGVGQAPGRLEASAP